MIFDQPPPQFNPTTFGAGCFLTFNGKMLLLLRQDYKPQGNTWGQPAGKIEKNEQPLDAIIRELFEETGISADKTQMKHCKTFYVSYPEYDFIYHTFSLDLEEEPNIIIEEKSHKEFGWFGKDEIFSLALMPELDRCLEYYYKNHKESL